MFKNGDTFSGEFRNGDPVRGIFVSQEGSVKYDGCMKRYVKDGRGALYINEKLVYDGIWQENKVGTN